MFDASDLTWIDFETLSARELKAAGTVAYAADATTRAIVLAYAIGDAPARTWHADGVILDWNDAPDDLRAAYDRGAILAAWNASFDSAIWNYSTVDFPFMTPERVIDPMIQAGVANLPTDLESASRALGGAGKQKDGKKLIKLFCVEGAAPADHPEEWRRFLSYARQDVEAMRDVYRRTRPLPLDEWQQYWAFEHINQRGVVLDLPFVRRAAALAAEDAVAIGRRLTELTEGTVTRVTQAKRIASWMHDQLADAAMREALTIGAPDEDGEDNNDEELEFSLTRDRVARVLAMLEAKHANGGLDAGETKALEAAMLRLYGAGSSPKKFARLDAQQVDGVLRGQYRFAGAGQTGRLTSKGAQIQNLTRDVLGEDGGAEAALVDRIAEGCSYAELVAAAPVDVPAARKLALLVRPSLIAGPGKVLAWSDWSAIEARIGPWLVASPGAEDVLDIFRANDADPTRPDIYTLAAAGILHKDPREITRTERAIGKVAVLALGFGGSVGALENMALAYRIHLDAAEARRVVDAWRAANSWAREFWGALWAAALSAWELPGRITQAGRLAFVYRDDYLGGALFMALPSGRLLTYPRPRWRDVELLDKAGNPTGEKRSELSFRRAHGRAKLWHGTLCLAGNSLVLTENGWLRIDQLKSQRVWDGEDFVAHGGVVCNGLRHVIDYDGVTMTPDHLILTTEGWKHAREGYRFDRAPVRLPDGVGPGWRAEQEPPLVHPLPMREGVDRTGHQSDARQGHRRLSILRSERQEHDAWHVAASGLCGLAFAKGSLPAADASSLAQLRRLGDFGLRPLAGEFRELLGGHGADLSPGVDDRADRQHGRLYAEKLHLGDPQGAGTRPTNQPSYCNALGHDNSVGSLGTEQHRRDDDPLPPRPNVRPVFDILDAGHHHQFVVAGRSGPTLVHNCENATQAAAADILRQTVTRIETNPALAWMPIRMTTHDEIVVEVDEARVGEAKALLRREMLTLPDWAAGLPLQSEESVCSYCTKAKAALQGDKS